MKEIHPYDSNLLLWWKTTTMIKFITIMKIHLIDAVSLQVKKFIIHTESYHNNPQWYSFKWGQFWLLVDKYEEIYSNWGKFCIMLNVKFITMMKLHYFDHNSITRLRFRTMMWIYFYNENSSLWWKFIILVKILHFDECSSLF